MQYVRVYADSAGESHFQDVDIKLTPARRASSLPPLHVSAFALATQYGFMRAPAGWRRPLRPTPDRELFFYLTGEVESEVSDGEVRRFGPGSVLLAEDTTGKGHASRVVGTDDVLLAVVQVPD